jgi:hypothetical protein
MEERMKGMLKWPLVIAAIVIVARIVLEQSGAPDTINNLFSVVVLYVFIVPIYFALRIANSGFAHPYKTLLKNVAIYAALARAMVIPTYFLAYIYEWPAQRFAATGGGVVGLTPLNACIIVIAAFAIWVTASVVIGGGIGSVIIALRRRAVTA